MNEIKVSGEVVSRPKIFRTVNDRIICKFTLKVMRELGNGSVYIPCNLHGEDAEVFFGSADIVARCGSQRELIADEQDIQVAGKIFILMDERSKRAQRAYLASRLRKTGSPQILPLGVRR